MIEEKDPWEGYDPDAPIPEPATPEQLEKASQQLAIPRRRPPYGSYILMPFTLLWGIGHIYILYMMAGTPRSGEMFVVLLFNLLLLAHYFILLALNIGRWRHET